MKIGLRKGYAMPFNGETVRNEYNADQVNFMDFFNTIRELCFILDMNGNILHVNQTVVNRLGYSCEELKGKSVLAVHPTDRWDEANQNVIDMLAGLKEMCPIPLQTKSGALISVETRVCEGVWDGQAVLYGVSKDITALQLSEEKFSKVFNITPALLAISSIADDRLIDVNDAFCETLGFKRDAVLGKTAVELGIFVDNSDRVKALAAMRTTKGLKNHEVRVKSKKGEIYTGIFSAAEVYIGAKKYLLTTMNDITEIKKLNEQVVAYNLALEELVNEKIKKIDHICTHDESTGLPNLNALRVRCDARETSYNLGNNSAILMRLNRYRHISNEIQLNELSALVVEVADRIKGIAGRWGDLYRTGADEFALILNTNSADFVLEKAARIRKEIAREVSLKNGRVICLTASVGISIGGIEKSLDEVVKNAEEALFMASKEANKAIIYDDSMQAARLRDTLLEVDLQSAVAKRELDLAAQPIVSLGDNKVKMLEGLLRWNHPEHGVMQPGQFIPIAETSNLIIPITEWVIQKTCENLSKWKAANNKILPVSVNLSAVTLENRSEIFRVYVNEQVKRYEVDPSLLIFEITESAILTDRLQIIENINLMRADGFRFALDDFGTGYSSFGLLSELPVEFVKLDRSLLQNFDTCEKTRSIVRAMVKVVHELGFSIIAEGIETSEEHEFVRACDSDYAQGYLFGKPALFEGYLL
jgi:PAS domain S-box-containing protein/diguanylate cyclase (GGDEF)-like protein